MGLTKGKLGQFIELKDVRNSDLRYGEDRVRGVNTSKHMMPTRADLESRDLGKFQIVAPKWFFFNHRTSRNGSKFSITFNDTAEDIICTEDYVVFTVSNYGMKYVVPEWLFIFFNRPEFDRFVITNSWGSSTEFYNWEDMCDIDIELPDISVQQKYVDVYNAMLANQRSYEQGLEDLKLVCDGYINNLDYTSAKPIKNYIERNIERNADEVFSKADVKGFNNEGDFIKPMRLFSGDVSTFKIIKNNYFVYNSRINSTIKKLSIALNEGNDLIVTPAYESFYVSKPDELHPYYLYMLLQQENFARKVLFNSFGSATLVFDLDDLGDIEIPMPSINIQISIANIYKVYKERKAINERLKAQIKDLCPILIKGSIEESV